MPYDAEQREAEGRKLDALLAISLAIGALGKGLATSVEQNSQLGKRLDSVDRKLDKLLKIAGARDKR